MIQSSSPLLVVFGLLQGFAQEAITDDPLVSQTASLGQSDEVGGSSPSLHSDLLDDDLNGLVAQVAFFLPKLAMDAPELDAPDGLGVLSLTVRARAQDESIIKVP